MLSSLDFHVSVWCAHISANDSFSSCVLFAQLIRPVFFIALSYMDTGVGGGGGCGGNPLGPGAP
jgi:hypothetical protein